MAATCHCGDQNASLIKTATGLINAVGHNVSEPHPYDRTNLTAVMAGWTA